MECWSYKTGHLAVFSWAFGTFHHFSEYKLNDKMIIAVLIRWLFVFDRNVVIDLSFESVIHFSFSVVMILCLTLSFVLATQKWTYKNVCLGQLHFLNQLIRINQWTTHSSVSALDNFQEIQLFFLPACYVVRWGYFLQCARISWAYIFCSETSIRGRFLWQSAMLLTFSGIVCSFLALAYQHIIFILLFIQMNLSLPSV